MSAAPPQPQSLPLAPVILVVDDAPTIRALVSRRLMNEGFQRVHLARNGEEAVQIAGQVRPDIILLDIVMPGMQGTEALSILRRDHPQAAIYMMTSLSELTVARECRDKGATGFVLKQDTGLPQAVSERVSDWCRSHQPPASPSPGSASHRPP